VTIDRRIFTSVLAALFAFSALALGAHAAYDNRYGQWGYEQLWYRLTVGQTPSFDSSPNERRYRP